jgi:hypothetical protein
MVALYHTNQPINMFVVSLPRMPLYAYNIFSCIIKKICVLKIDKTTYNLRRGVCIFLLSLLARSSISNSSTWSSAICRGSRACRGGTASILIQLRRRLALLSATHTFLLLPATELRTHSSKSSSWCMKSLSRSRCEVVRTQYALQPHKAAGEALSDGIEAE